MLQIELFNLPMISKESGMLENRLVMPYTTCKDLRRYKKPDEILLNSYETMVVDDRIRQDVISTVKGGTDRYINGQISNKGIAVFGLGAFGSAGAICYSYVFRDTIRGTIGIGPYITLSLSVPQLVGILGFLLYHRYAEKKLKRLKEDLERTDSSEIRVEVKKNLEDLALTLVRKSRPLFKKPLNTGQYGAFKEMVARFGGEMDGWSNYLYKDQISRWRHEELPRWPLIGTPIG